MELISVSLDTYLPMTRRRFTGMTDPGLVRSVNQDSFYLDPEGRFFIVADGMGGHAGGQEASQIAARCIRAKLEESWDGDLPSDVLLEEAFMEANDGILSDQAGNPERGDMGTTAIVILFRNDGAWRAHVGDSRLYRLREETLEQLSADHTWVARALKMGDITLEQAKAHPWRHVLFQCLGRKDLNSVEIARFEAHSGDLYLLCSDGLTEEVSDHTIHNLLLAGSPSEETASKLVEAAKESGGSDNITVVLVSQD